MKIVTILSLIFIFSIVVFGQTMTIKVYFGNEKKNPGMLDCAKVYPVKRTIPRTKSVAFASLQELFKGVTDEERAQGYTSYSPEETKGILKSVKIKNKAAYVNFSKVIYQQLPNATSSCGSEEFLSYVETTLKQFPTVKKVFYAIERNPMDFYDWLQSECPKELKNCSNKNF